MSPPSLSSKNIQISHIPSGSGELEWVLDHKNDMYWLLNYIEYSLQKGYILIALILYGHSRAVRSTYNVPYFQDEPSSGSVTTGIPIILTGLPGVLILLFNSAASLVVYYIMELACAETNIRSHTWCVCVCVCICLANTEFVNRRERSNQSPVCWWVFGRQAHALHRKNSTHNCSLSVVGSRTAFATICAHSNADAQQTTLSDSITSRQANGKRHSEFVASTA